MSLKNIDFEIHLTGEDPRKDTKVRAYRRMRKRDKIVQSEEGKKVENVKIAVFTAGNQLIAQILDDKNVLDDILNKDDELDLEIAGKIITKTSTLLVNSKNYPCYNFMEYEIIRNREGKIVPCEQCGEIYCSHRVKKQTKENINQDKNPVRWIKVAELNKLEALKKWSFSVSYQLRHVDGLTYQFLYDIAKTLQEKNIMVLMAPIQDKKPQKLVLRNGGKPFYGWLEGRIEGEKYALILHRTTLRLD